ncbi:hypothetical protein J2Z83_000067 [Virgibacillus natechei]|uniref:Phage protein n=1 Tax=Virgibacillus natechei TaxID=1216297 RepID=A0ABS4IAL8_9BACI|nr:hypothetical protein [Virgibacillus natechei]MBP1967975.1 hypothetical protein [Virgibacillus natechei]UZD14739.1 hypothetical protein OLD84_09655 [Virgibacillus natechei]
MENFTIELKIDGKKKRFTTPAFVKGGLFRQAVEISQSIENEVFDINKFDGYIQFVTEVFGEKFTVDEFENGIDGRELLKTIYATTFFVLDQVSTATKMLAGDTEAKQDDGKK